MKKINLFISLFVLTSLTSCSFILKQTLGRHSINKQFGDNSTVKHPFQITIPYELFSGSIPYIHVKINDSDSVYRLC